MRWVRVCFRKNGNGKAVVADAWGSSVSRQGDGRKRPLKAGVRNVRGHLRSCTCSSIVGMTCVLLISKY